MKKLKYFILKSFSLRLTLYILLTAATIFVITLLLSYYSAYSHVHSEAQEKAEVTLDNTILQIDNVLNSVETAVHNIAWLVPTALDNPEYMYSLTKKLIESNPYICGSAIAFEPFSFEDKGRFYSPYSYREGDSIVSKQLGTADYDYHYMDWYQIPKLLGSKYWSEPYYDAGGANLIMTTFAYPLYDAEGRMYAIFTADISLEWFADMVNNIKPYPNSYNFMIGRGGSFLVHRRKEAILNETIFANSIYSNDEVLNETGHKMVDGKKGMTKLDREGHKFYLFYAPIKATGWSVAVACMYSDIFAGIDHMRNITLLVALLGLLLMTLFCYYTIRRQTMPLKRFADSATDIAHGDFNAKLPVIYSRDEMRILSDSFRYMQKSLKKYIEELKDTTVKKERIESELRIAHDIQMGMLPKIFPPFPQRNDVELHARLVPAKEVGGDLYDFFINDNKLYFIVGDVSGKGVPASLLMAVTCRLFRTVSSHMLAPSEIVSALNNALADSNESCMFCTFFLGILDLKSGELKYCNAGHNPPVIMGGDGKVEFMSVNSNIPLGLMEDFAYEDECLVLEKGTSLFLYTDGVTEAENGVKELFSDDKLLHLLKENCNCSPDEITDRVMAGVVSHASCAEQSDDITMMCIKFK
ncbi:MAG: SpoIIE family protein phosphatase [Bacteroidaceae bacterium]|nr:SpoIIE family protein phosphatase [Bacteroidaceae bacterium]MBQ4038767.1 SpoIIE family protein phosphatase [Bacteroidaceae bacterium]